MKEKVSLLFDPYLNCLTFKPSPKNSHPELPLISRTQDNIPDARSFKHLRSGGQIMFESKDVVFFVTFPSKAVSLYNAYGHIRGFSSGLCYNMHIMRRIYSH